MCKWFEHFMTGVFLSKACNMWSYFPSVLQSLKEITGGNYNSFYDISKTDV